MDPAEAAALAVLLALLSALALIDFRRQILPNLLVYPGILAAAAAAPVLPADGYIISLLGGVIAFVAFALVYFFLPGVIGGGDVKLAALVGFAIGFPDAIFGLALGTVLGAGVAIFMLAIRRWSLKTRIAYGPYLCVGAGAVALAASL